MSENYGIEYSEEAAADVRSLRAFDRKQLLDAIELHLTVRPKEVSRSRIKLMDQPFWSQFRLRVGDFRVYYDVDDERETVYVLRVLEKGTKQTLEEAS